MHNIWYLSLLQFLPENCWIMGKHILTVVTVLMSYEDCFVWIISSSELQITVISWSWQDSKEVQIFWQDNSIGLFVWVLHSYNNKKNQLLCVTQFDCCITMCYNTIVIHQVSTKFNNVQLRKRNLKKPIYFYVFAT